MASIGYPALRTSEAPGAASTVAAQGIPWYIWCTVASLTSAVLGMQWDASWHRSIGRDTFWTPAHMAIYACGVLSGISCAYLILTTTFARRSKQVMDLRAHSVEIFGLRGPLGSFMAAWGGIAMLVSAPFDNWWHSAYGLDVRFVSPPHLMVSLGLWFIMLGGLVLVLSYMNRAAEESTTQEGLLRFKKLQRLMLYMGGLLVTEQMFVCFSYTWDTHLHQSKAYIATAIFIPIAYAVIWTASRHRWANTITTTMYTLLVIVLIQVFPLFPASPRLGPVFTPVTHFIPPRFPMLLIVPAIALDLLWQRTSGWTGRRRQLLLAALSGTLFTALFWTTEWNFAEFLLTPAARNRFFGTMYFGFSDNTGPMPIGTWEFIAPTHGLHLALGLTIAMLWAGFGTWAGMTIGRMVQTVRR